MKQAALAEVQKQQALTEQQVNLENAKSQFEIQRMQVELEGKKHLMAQQFEYDRQLAEIEAQTKTLKEQEIEDRKDKRIKMEGSQQSQLIDQRQNDSTSYRLSTITSW